MKEIKVDSLEIYDLLNSAKGFKKGFYNMIKILSPDGETFSCIGSIALFSIELFLKTLCAISNYNENNGFGKYLKDHNLSKLYIYLKNDDSKYVTDLENQFEKSKYHTNNSLETELSYFKIGFEEWRYSFNYQGDLSLNLNVISCLLNNLEQYASEKIKLIQIKENNKKTRRFVYSNFEDICGEIF